MPALEAAQSRFRAAGTQVMGVSVDSIHSHAAWGRSLGGVSFPLLADFQPKGKVAQALGLYLDEPGITDRATVVVDKNGEIVYHDSVTPAGERDIEQLLQVCEKIGGDESGLPKPEKIPDGTILYVKDPCGHSARALAAVDNLHLQDVITVKSISEDANAQAELEKKAGKAQAPCLVIGNEPMFEAADIAKKLADLAAPLPR